MIVNPKVDSTNLDASFDSIQQEVADLTGDFLNVSAMENNATEEHLVNQHDDEAKM